MDDLAHELIRRHGELKAARGTWEAHWQELADFVRPLRADFTGPRSPGEKRSREIYDGTPGHAVEALAAGLWGMVTNAANQWFALTIDDPDLAGFQPVKEWLDLAAEHMRSLFAHNGGQFYARVFELYADLATFGTGVFYSEDVVGEGYLRFSTRPLAETCVAEDDGGTVDTVFRSFEMTARQAVQRFGDGQLEGKLRDAAEKQPDRAFPFLHAVLPAKEVEGKAERGKPWASLYVDVTGRKVLRRGGFAEFPFQVPRWSTAAGEVYGRSPAMLALADVKMLNQMARSTIEAAHKAVNPPLIAFDDGVYRPMRLYPGSVNFGGVNQDGRPLVQPLLTGTRVDIGLEMEEQRRGAIREAFYFSLMQMVGRADMTATEVMARQEEKLRLLGPHLGRLQSEFLDPLIDRVFAVMQRNRQLPEPPPELEGRELKVDYVSPLAKAQKAADGQAMLRALESIAPLAQIEPTVVDNFDPDALARRLAEAWGAPAAILRGQDEVAELRQQRAQAQAAQQQMAMLQQAAKAAEQGAGAAQRLAATEGGAELVQGIAGAMGQAGA